MRLARRVLILSVVVVLLGACRADWHQWGDGPERTGANAFESTIGTANVSGLHQLWSTDLGGFINSAPIVAANMTVGTTSTDVIYAGTELGEFYALTADGQVLWHRNLGSHVTTCPDTPGDTFGVQASAVFDRYANRVYVMGGAGSVYALDPLTGATVPGWPVQITTDPVHEAFYGAPNLFGSSLYLTVASHCDAVPYKGRVVRVDVNTRATNAWYVGGSATGPDGGGIWGWGGVSVDPVDGNVYAATGNLITSPENLPWGDSVVRLTPQLGFVAGNTPGRLIGDDDFGSTPVLFHKPGCPAQLVAMQKNGRLHLYDRDAIAQGPRQSIVMASTLDGTGHVVPVQEFIGVAAYSPQTQMVYVPDPSGTVDGTFTRGMVGFTIDANCRLVKAWNTRAGNQDAITSAPSVANGVVYYADGSADRIHAFNAVTGQELWNSGTTVGSVMVTQPVVANGRVYEGSYDNHLHAFGL
jgi:outer membrane protein assembly factor BamB